MNEQLKPIKKEELPEYKKELPNTKETEEQNIVTNLPEWSIEPPIEINRSTE